MIDYLFLWVMDYFNNMKNKGITISIPILLTIVFVVLQVCGVINQPWYFILSPILISVVLGIVVTILVLFILSILLFLKLIIKI